MQMLLPLSREQDPWNGDVPYISLVTKESSVQVDHHKKLASFLLCIVKSGHQLLTSPDL